MAALTIGGGRMTKYSLDANQTYDEPDTIAAGRVGFPGQRDGTTCDLYAPGHQIHYKHQGDAVRSPSRVVRDAHIEGTLVVLDLEDESELRWRHHDPDRMRSMLEMLRGKCVAYPDFHAVRVGPYWFNCAPENDEWMPCRVSTVPPPR